MTFQMNKKITLIFVAVQAFTSLISAFPAPYEAQAGMLWVPPNAVDHPEGVFTPAPTTTTKTQKTTST
ncbi:hypothetical protein K7432_011807 [Basidiobolus ranarum]|uniref:Secreted protein n=1 Tax=Basidiobolus ranarum TaxID=34480 RepID=A0ABR2WLU9_9FUNG